jgi:hypothetical protein
LNQSAPLAGSPAQAGASDLSPGGTLRQALPVRQPVADGNISVSPGHVDFGSVREDETREIRVQLRAHNVQGPVSGRVVRCPAWITAHPLVFDRSKQVLSLVANGAKAGVLGETTAIIRVELDGDVADIPASIQIIPARPKFAQVASWFVPLFASAMLPIAAVLYASNGAQASTRALAAYAPAAATATGLLTMMLLLIAVAADIGMAERAACGLVSAAMGAVLGVSSARWQPGVFDVTMTHTLLTGVPLGGMLFLQLLSLRRWRWWAFVTACTGLAIGIGFFTQLK